MILFYIIKKVLLVYSQTTVLILDSEIKNNPPKLLYEGLGFLFKRKKISLFYDSPKLILAKFLQNVHSRKLIQAKCNFFLTRVNIYKRKFVR